MPSTFTSLLRFEDMATGEKSNTWGDVVDTTHLLAERAIAGTSAVTHDDSADYTLTTNNGADDEARYAVLNISGTLTANRNVVCPTSSKTYIIDNNTTGGFSITLKTSGGTGITITNGARMYLYCDGTNVVDAITAFSSGLTLTTPTISGAALSGTISGSPTASGTWTYSATDHVILPGGTTAQRSGTTEGQFRKNTDNNKLEHYNGSAWAELLDISSAFSVGGVFTMTATSHIILPGGTTAQRSGTTEGQLRKNTDNNKLEHYNGSAWSELMDTSSNFSVGGTMTYTATDHMILPGGTTAQRSGTTEGQFRKNTSNNKLEHYNGSAWAELVDNQSTFDLTLDTLAVTVTTLSDTATISWDMSVSNNAKVTLGGDRTLGAPTGVTAGSSGYFEVLQDPTGGRTLAFNAAYVGDTDKELASDANDRTLYRWDAVTTGIIVLKQLFRESETTLGPYKEYDLGTLGVGVTETQAHGLGKYPSIVELYYECTTNDGSYVVGDRLQVSGIVRSDGAVINSFVHFNTTNVVVQHPATDFVGVTSSGAQDGLNASSWKAVIRVFE